MCTEPFWHATVIVMEAEKGTASRLELGVWRLEFSSAWSLEFGALGAWSLALLELGVWRLELGVWSLEFGALGAWSLALGAWSLELGVWRLELGVWSLEFVRLTLRPRARERVCVCV